jgi:predicted extracellular nuclease
MRLASSCLSIVFSLLACTACGGPGPYPERIPIGNIQGPVNETQAATRHRSPLNGETVTVRGVVHQILRWTVRDGRSNWGLMIQDLPAEADGNPLTSDGLFVYAGFGPTLPMENQGDYTARVGDVVVLRGKVNERFAQTELSEAKVLSVSPGGDVNQLLPPVEMQLSPDPAQSARRLERWEGMRVSLPAGAVAMSGSHPEQRNGDLRIWVATPDHPVLKRPEVEERRLFRGGHPLSGLNTAEERVAGHGQKVELGSLALRERLTSAAVLLPLVRAGSEVRSAVTGGVHYSYNSYVLQVEAPPDLRPAPAPEPLLKALAPDENTLRIAVYNVENLYDFVNDPFDNCDFEGDPGCRGTRFPLNYVPESDEVYRARLQFIARQIVNDLHSPHVLMIQEVEDQDVGRFDNGSMRYGDKNNADGELDALQELVIQIVALGGPIYGVAVDRSAADERGIICAYLYQTDRLRPVDPDAHPLLGETPELPAERDWFPETRNAANPKAFNAKYNGPPDSNAELSGVFPRAMQVFVVEDLRTKARLWLLNNHFSSGPDRLVERRTQQAAINADISKEILKLNPDALLVVGGDLNVFPRPDDPHNPPSDQLAPLYNAGLFNAVDRVFAEKPSNARSYIFQGEANILDHMFLSPEMKRRLLRALFVPINSGEAEGLSPLPVLRASDHDPLVIDVDSK